MNYGTLKVDTLIYTSGESDQAITVSSVVVGNYPNLSITGTISGAVITGDTGRFNTLTGQTVTVPGTISGTTITGDTTNISTLTGVSGTFTTSVSGAVITGDTGRFNALTGNTVNVTGTISGTVITGDTGRFNAFTGHVVTVEGTLSGGTITGNTAKVTTLTGISGTFTDTVSGAVVTGNTGRFNQLTGHVVTVEATLSGATITGNTAKVTTLTGTTGVLTGSAGIGLTSITSNATVDVNGSYVGNAASVSSLNIDCSSGNYFTKTIAGNSTFTVSNVPASGRSYGLTLEITHTSGTITWFSGVQWPASTAPTLTEGKTHLFIFITDDGGTRWRAGSLVDYVN